MNFRNPTAEVLPVEKDFTDKSKYTGKVNLMDLNFCSPTMSSFDPCLAEICKLKSIIWDKNRSLITLRCMIFFFICESMCLPLLFCVCVPGLVWLGLVRGIVVYLNS